MVSIPIRRSWIALMVFSMVCLLAGCAQATPITTDLPNTLPGLTATESPTVDFTITPTVRPNLLRTRFAGLPLTQTARLSANATQLPPTPTEEPTSTPWPTITPLVPTPPANQAYQLTEWTPEKAAKLIEELKNYPETLNFMLRGYLDGGYYYSFRYAGLAELESALRFPQAEQRQSWQWDGAYHLYQSYNEEIGSLYAGLIANALNQKETNLEELETWLAEIVPFNLQRYPITPPPGYQNSFILYFQNPDDASFAGGFAVWLVQKAGQFNGYHLPNMFEIAYGDGDSSFEAIDLTGDGIAEAIVQNIDWGSFGMHNGDLKIYQINQVPPQPVRISPPLFEPSIATWSVKGSDVNPGITFQIPVSKESMLPCGTFLTDLDYQWQAGQLKLTRFSPPPLEEMEKDPFCTRVLASTLRYSGYLENPLTLAAYKALLDLPFIEKDLTDFEYPFRLEEERLNLAIYLSDHGDEAGANEQIQKIRAGTDTENAQWRPDALAFYAARLSPQTLFQFCLASQTCQSFLSRAEILSNLPVSRFSEIEILVAQLGFQAQFAGDYDFDQDGQSEKWLFIKNEDYACTGEFWVFTKYGNAIKNRSMGTQCLTEIEKASSGFEIIPLETNDNLRSYQVAIDGREMLYTSFLYWSLDQDSPTADDNALTRRMDAIQNQIMLGQTTPEEAHAQLKEIKKRPVELMFQMSNRIPQMLYLLGLTHELSGELDQAAETYLELWKSYPDDAFGLMAYAKLEPVR